MPVKTIQNYLSDEFTNLQSTPAIVKDNTHQKSNELSDYSPITMNKRTDASKNILQFLCFNSPYGGSFFKSLLKLEQKLKDDGVDMIYLFMPIRPIISGYKI